MKRCLVLVMVPAICACAASSASAALVGYYKFNGNANEATGSNINLNLVGDAGFGPSLNSGLGSALSLDGTGDGAVGPDYVKITTNNMTGVAWVYAQSLDGDWNTIVKNWGTSVGGQFHFGLGSVAANTLQDVANGASNVMSPSDLPVNEWVHTAFVLDSAPPTPEHRLYINGQLVATAAYTGTMGPGAATGLGVGHKPNNDGSALDAGGGPGPWNGRIDEVGLYNEALTGDQIRQIYENGLAGIQLDGTRVPEPSTLASLLFCGVGLIAGRRRPRR